MRPVLIILLLESALACHGARSQGDAAATASDSGPASNTPTMAAATVGDAGPGSSSQGPAVTPSQPGTEKTAEGELHHVQVTISGALEKSLDGALPKEVAQPLSQVVARVLVWWVDLRRGLNKGDEVQVVYSLPPGKEPELHALAWISSQGKGKHLAYLFQAPGAPFARYYDAEGKEVELRLVDGPLDSYDQVTSLLRDGRRHKGVDFRTPTGTPVKMPFDGTLERKNWAFRSNGNCLQFHDSASGRSAIFLHLSPLPKDLQVGQHFNKGEVIAKSDNSGHSFAPHLHYQLESSSGSILDPFEIHKTYRAELPAEAKAAFAAQVGRLNPLLGQK